MWKKIIDSKILLVLTILLLIVVLSFDISEAILWANMPQVTLSESKQGTLENVYEVIVNATQKDNVVVCAQNVGILHTINVTEGVTITKGAVLAAGDFGNIVAPCDGVVLSTYGAVGMAVQAETPLFKIASKDSEIHLSVTLPRTLGEVFDVGDEVKIQTIKNNRQVTKKANIVNKSINASFDAYIFEIQLSNPDGILNHGDRLQLEFSKQSSLYPCIVPKSALIAIDENKYYLYVAEATDDPQIYYTMRYEVSLVAENAVYAAINRALPDGTMIVTSTTGSLGVQSEVRLK